MTGLLELSLVLLLIATLVSGLAPRLKLPAEVIMVFGAAALSFVPGVPEVSLDPNIVLQVFLPPILFAAAYFTSWRDFKQNLRPISLLAVGLVLFTTLLVAIALKFLVPWVPWAYAFILGAIVSPPDASSAAAITKKLGVPRRLVTILEGESLINDASALVIYKFALVAALTGTFSLPEAVGRFVWLAAGGASVGFLVSWVSFETLRRIRDVSAQVMLSFLTAFASYLLAEHLGFSSVISAVVGGLYYGRQVPELASAELSVDALAAWKSLLFIINGLVFTLMGLQIGPVRRGLGDDYTQSELVIYAIGIALVVLIVRLIWVFPATYVPRWLIPSIRRKDPSPPLGVIMLLSWVGMRGIVSMAAALAIPLTLPDGRAFPHRELILYLTYTTILISLLVPVLTLKPLMRLLGVKPDDLHLREESLARVQGAESVLAALKRWKVERKFPDATLDPMITRWDAKLASLRSNLKDEGFSGLFSEEQTLRRVTREMIQVERDAIRRLRRQNQIHDEIFHLISRELDIEDLRLRSTRV